jgi:uncharacterized protein (TIGR00661 family)
MKIFYGVNGTGNGHITRARVMAKELALAGIEVQFMFSGRDKSEYFDMEIFGNAWYRNGLTFAIDSGKINKWKTIKQLNLLQFFIDVTKLNLCEFDLVITDYEPITSLAASRRNIKTIGIGHQYAFNHNIPVVSGNKISKFIMKHYAPASIGLGMHWHHFGNKAILPPIIEVDKSETIENKIIVYLPFEDSNFVIDLLSPFNNYEFFVFGSKSTRSDVPEHVHLLKASREEFKNHLSSSDGVICNSGFELVSEALTLGKKILVKPVHGQMEQESNALALRELRFGSAFSNIDHSIIRTWLTYNIPKKVVFPNVAKHVVEWLQTDRESLPDFNIWGKVEY